VRLGLALNFSVFYYEIMGDAKKACAIAKDALQTAIERIDECSEDLF
jgi:14-3-3 protein